MNTRKPAKRGISDKERLTRMLAYGPIEYSVTMPMKNRTDIEEVIGVTLGTRRQVDAFLRWIDRAAIRAGEKKR